MIGVEKDLPISQYGPQTASAQNKLRKCAPQNRKHLRSDELYGVELRRVRQGAPQEFAQPALTASAIEFLEATPELEPVLHANADRVTPSSWSRSRANVMQPRADTIAELIQHEREEIANAANSVSDRLAMAIKRERVRDRQRDEEREQRFE